MSNARKLVPVNSPTLVLKRSEVFPQSTANDVVTVPGAAYRATRDASPVVISGRVWSVWHPRVALQRER